MLMNKEDGLCYCTHVHVADIRECQDTSGIEDDDYGDNYSLIGLGALLGLVGKMGVTFRKLLWC